MEEKIIAVLRHLTAIFGCITESNWSTDSLNGWHDLNDKYGCSVVSRSTVVFYTKKDSKEAFLKGDMIEDLSLDWRGDLELIKKVFRDAGFHASCSNSRDRLCVRRHIYYSPKARDNKITWIEATRRAIDKHCKEQDRSTFYREDFIKRRLEEICVATTSQCRYPEKALDGALSKLVKDNTLIRRSKGQFELIGFVKSNSPPLM